MEERRRLGIITGQYEGDGEGENVAADPGGEEDFEDIMEKEDTEEDVYADSEGETVLDKRALPLLFFFDIETTGLQVYSDAITDIGAKVFDIPPTSVSRLSYTSLVMTSKNIPDKGIEETKIYNYVRY